MPRSIARIRWILVIVYIAAFLAVAPYSQAEVIQHGTEEFCQLSGFVYNDLNNDGTRGEKEWFIPEVEITLTGITITGESVSMTTTTGNTGTYVFKEVPGGHLCSQRNPARDPPHRDGQSTWFGRR